MTQFFLLGSDARFSRLAEKLSQRGRVFREIGAANGAENEGSNRNVYVFPFRQTEAEWINMLSPLPKNGFVFVWQAGAALKRLCEEKNFQLTEYAADKIYRAENAKATAEGALASVLTKTESLLAGECVLVCGYGACGQELARLFWLCGCEVFVFSRARGLKAAAEDGFNTLSSLSTPRLAMFDVVLNTVPEAIFPASVLENFREGSFFFQIASGTSGIDTQLLKKREVSYVPLPGLPAIFAPQSEAEALEALILEKCGEGSQWQ